MEAIQSEVAIGPSPPSDVTLATSGDALTEPGDLEDDLPWSGVVQPVQMAGNPVALRSTRSWTSDKSTTSQSSSSSAVCRICQLSERETGMDISQTGCGCRGSIDKCHVACLQEWVRRRDSLRCELCSQNFSSTSVHLAPRRPQEALVTLDTPEQDRGCLRNLCSDSRRVWFVVVMVILLFSVLSSASLLVFVRDSWGDNRTSTTYDICYSLVLALLVFCCTLTVGLAILWTLVEVYFWPREARRMQRWRTLQRVSQMNVHVPRRSVFSPLALANTRTPETVTPL